MKGDFQLTRQIVFSFQVIENCLDKICDQFCIWQEKLDFRWKTVELLPQALSQYTRDDDGPYFYLNVTLF